jgi:hypothetical protein
MSVTVYKDTNYGGAFAYISPGYYHGEQLRGFKNQSSYTYGEDFNNEISSIRVNSGVIAVLYSGYAKSASGGSRVIIGPQDVSNLSSIGMDDKISALQVVNFKNYDSGAVRGGVVTLFSDYGLQGRRASLGKGDYNSARLASEEISFPTSNTFRSLTVGSNIIAILYAGDNYSDSDDGVMIVGPKSIEDLTKLGMIDRVKSIKIVYTDSSTTVGNSTIYNNYSTPVSGVSSTIPTSNDPSYTTQSKLDTRNFEKILNDSRNKRLLGSDNSSESQDTRSVDTPGVDVVWTKPESKNLYQKISFWIIAIILFIVAAMVLSIVFINKNPSSRNTANITSYQLT